MNLLARNLAIPLDPPSALEVILEGKTTELHAGMVNDELFLNSLTLGLYPQVAMLRERRRQAHKRWPKLARWLVDTTSSVIYVLRNWRLLRFSIQADTFISGGYVPTLAIVNNPIPVTETHCEKEGLTVYEPRSVSRLGLLGIAFRTIVGLEAPPLHIHTLNYAEIRIPAGTPMAMDGEVSRSPSILRLHSLPKHLRICVP